MVKLQIQTQSSNQIDNFYYLEYFSICSKALGFVHRYSLNESIEVVRGPDGIEREVKVEEVFELNYQTGHYQKCRFQMN